MSWKNSKGQMQQVFLFLSAIIVILATIFIGVKLFTGLENTACEANDVGFVSDVKRTLDANAVYGSRNEVDIPVPCDSLELCFVDTVEIGNQNFESEDTVMTTTVRNGVKMNIFLQKKGGLLAVGYDERIIVGRSPEQDVGDMYLCFDTQGGDFSFHTEGYGRFIKVSP